jgi:hypothetical protein
VLRPTKFELVINLGVAAMARLHAGLPVEMGSRAQSAPAAR